MLHSPTCDAARPPHLHTVSRSTPIHVDDPSPAFRRQRAGGASVLDQMVASGPVVLPSLLQCDFGHLHREVERLQDAGARALHLDVMDGRFVPQLTYGPVVVEAVRRAARVPLDVHLMIEDPVAVVADYASAGADILTIHVEAVADPLGALQAIHEHGMLGFLSISPGTPVESLQPFLAGCHRDLCDGVLVMSVEPGYGGQAFMPASLDRLRAVAAFREGRERPLRLGIDGGISTNTVGPAADAGAELIVAGSAVLRSDDYARSIHELERIAREAA
jgi:ribulose-phosphate 3-epimerase